jgi:hypothetical protein
MDTSTTSDQVLLCRVAQASPGETIRRNRHGPGVFWTPLGQVGDLTELFRRDLAASRT